jgi:predicted regulator of Ras-like GTPase activity (Roadblock/LC7/MglB family)
MSPETASWSLDPTGQRRLDELLGGYVRQAAARCALLVDRAGQCLVVAGDAAWLDRTAFASLAAADFAASDQLAVLLGEEEFSSLYHQGETGSMVLADVSGRAILATLFDGRSTLGLVRLRLRAVLPECAELLELAMRRPPPEQRLVDPGWLDEAEDEIDRLFAG